MKLKILGKAVVALAKAHGTAYLLHVVLPSFVTGLTLGYKEPKGFWFAAGYSSIFYHLTWTNGLIRGDKSHHERCCSDTDVGDILNGMMRDGVIAPGPKLVEAGAKAEAMAKAVFSKETKH